MHVLRDFVQEPQRRLQVQRKLQAEEYNAAIYDWYVTIFTLESEVELKFKLLFF